MDVLIVMADRECQVLQRNTEQKSSQMLAFMKTHMRFLPRIVLEALEYGARETMAVVILLQSTRTISELTPIHHRKLTLMRAPMSPRDVSQRYSNGQIFDVMFKNG